MHNLALLRNRTRPGTLICPAIKADAYGHGLIPVARTLVDAGISWLAVATAGEARELHLAGVEATLLLLGVAADSEKEEVLESGASLVVSELDYIKFWQSHHTSRGRKLKVHIKIDTGMGRLGCAPRDFPGLLDYVRNQDNLVLEGVCTHFPSADNGKKEPTESQIALFRSCLEPWGLLPEQQSEVIIHAANSAALWAFPESHFHMVRPGIMLYGYPPSPELPSLPDLEPVMEIQSRLALVKKVVTGTPLSYGGTHVCPRDTLIGVVPMGYGDGYPRILSGQAHVSLGGRILPQVGRVCMDQFLVDLGPGSSARAGDIVQIIGSGSVPSQESAPGNAAKRVPQEAPDAAELAQKAGTIAYEITCGISGRVPRVHLGPGADKSLQQ